MSNKVGIIGAGNISSAYLRLGPLFKDIDLKAVADLNPETAASQAEAFDVEAMTPDALLADPEIGFVVNLTVPNAHYDVSMAAIAAGKHVYSEKPFVLSIDEALTLTKAATSAGLRIGSAPDTFLGASHQLARKTLDDGAIGSVIAGTVFFQNHGMEGWHPNPDFFFQPGGGPVLDIGPYYITNLVQLLGPVKRVVALGSTAHTSRTIGSGPREGETVPVDTPTNYQALLEFQSGATVTAVFSWDVWSHRHSYMELYGTEGTLFVPDPNMFGGEVEITARNGEAERVTPWEHPFSVPNFPVDAPREANYRAVGLADMIAAEVEGRPHRCSLELATHVIDIMTGILRSTDSGGFVEMQTTCDRPDPLGPDQARALMA